jgi:hypothetical protein
MNEFFTFLRNMGGLHDSVVRELVWAPSARTLTFRFEDIHSNFQGLPEYAGKRPGEVVLHGTTEVHIAIDSRERLTVFEFLPVQGKENEISVTFSPSGRVNVRFDRADFPR